MSYDVSTTAGKVRLLIGDTKVTDHLFDDTEIDAFLDMNGQSVKKAAAEAYGTIIRSRGLLAKVVSRGGYSSSAHALEELKSLKKELEESDLKSGGLQSDDFALNDDHFESYRPGWRDANEVVTE